MPETSKCSTILMRRVSCSHEPGPKLLRKQTSVSVISSSLSQNLEPPEETSEETSKMLPLVTVWPSFSAFSASSTLLALSDIP
jgi:hypothetical protein